MKHIAPFIQGTLLYGDDNLGLTVTKRNIAAIIRSINDSKAIAWLPDPIIR